MRTKKDFIRVTTPYSGYVTPISTPGPILYPLNLRVATCIEILNANIPLFEIVGDKAIKLTLNNLLDTAETEDIKEESKVEEKAAEVVKPANAKDSIKPVADVSVEIKDSVTRLVDTEGKPMDLPEGDFTVAESIKEETEIENPAEEASNPSKTEEPVVQKETTKSSKKNKNK